MRGQRPGSAGEPISGVVRTTCGRELVVGRLRLDGLGHPVDRVTLNVGCQPYDQGRVWASLTLAEARRLAGLLLAQAASVDRDDAWGVAARARRVPSRLLAWVLRPRG